MKNLFVFLLCSLTIFEISNANRDQSNIEEITTMCAAKLGYTKDEAAKVPVTDKHVNCMHECILKKMGMIDHDGFFISKKIIEYVIMNDKRHIDKKLFRKIISKCVYAANKEKDDECQRMTEFMKCMEGWL